MRAGAGEPECPHLASLAVSNPFPDSCVRARVGLRSRSLAGRRIRPKEPDMSLKAMSADSHMDLIYLPPDTFTSRMPSTWRDRAPHVVERDGRKVWVSGDAVLGPWGVYGPGVTGGRRGRILAEAGFASGTQTRPSNPIERRQDQERDGVEAEVIYGIIGDRKSTRLNSSHLVISYAVFCLKKKNIS